MFENTGTSRRKAKTPSPQTAGSKQVGGWVQRGPKEVNAACSKTPQNPPGEGRGHFASPVFKLHKHCTLVPRSLWKEDPKTFVELGPASPSPEARLWPCPLPGRPARGDLSVPQGQDSHSRGDTALHIRDPPCLPIPTPPCFVTPFPHPHRRSLLAVLVWSPGLLPVTCLHSVCSQSLGPCARAGRGRPSVRTPRDCSEVPRPCRRPPCRLLGPSGPR